MKARVHTKGFQIVKRTNEHLHEPDEESVTCQEVKIVMKRKTSETQNSSHLIVGDSLLTVSDGVSVKLPKLTGLKRTIQRQRERILATPAQPLTLEELVLPPDYQQTAKGENFLSTTLALDQREFSYSGRNATSRCWNHPNTGF